MFTIIDFPIHLWADTTSLILVYSAWHVSFHLGIVHFCPEDILPFVSQYQQGQGTWQWEVFITIQPSNLPKFLLPRARVPPRSISLTQCSSMCERVQVFLPANFCCKFMKLIFIWLGSPTSYKLGWNQTESEMKFQVWHCKRGDILLLFQGGIDWTINQYSYYMGSSQQLQWNS